MKILHWGLILHMAVWNFQTQFCSDTLQDLSSIFMFKCNHGLVDSELRKWDLAKQVGKVIDGRGFADSFPAAAFRRFYHHRKTYLLCRPQSLVNVSYAAFLKGFIRNHKLWWLCVHLAPVHRQTYPANTRLTFYIGVVFICSTLSDFVDSAGQLPNSILIGIS